MLVLARKLGQSIIIDNLIEVTVVEVRGDQVRLGLTAPRNISIYRKELLEQIRSENAAAASSAGLDEVLDIIEEKEPGDLETPHAGTEMEA